MRAEGLCANTSTCFLKRANKLQISEINKIRGSKTNKNTDLKKRSPEYETFSLLHYMALQYCIRYCYYEEQISKEVDIISVPHCLTDWSPSVFINEIYHFNKGYNKAIKYVIKIDN